MKQILEQPERKDINLANKVQTQHKIPKEYTMLRDATLKQILEVNRTHCTIYVPQFYTILHQNGLTPVEARAVVVKDGTELFGWSPITINQVISKIAPDAMNEVKAKAGRKSAEVKKTIKNAQLIAQAAVDESRRGPGRPRNPEQVFKVIVDAKEFLNEVKEKAEIASKGTGRLQIEISASGKLTLSVSLVESSQLATA
jgi:hypothetical protein